MCWFFAIDIFVRMKYIIKNNMSPITAYKVSFYFTKTFNDTFENRPLTDLIHKYSWAQSAFPQNICR